VKRNHTRPPLSVTADGRGIAAHAGTRLLADIADFTGLTSALSAALAPTVRRSRRHDPGRVLLDVALTLADGGDCLSDLHPRVSPREHAFDTRQSASHLGEWWLLKPHDPERKAPVW
jgi:hypothetical protein